MGAWIEIVMNEFKNSNAFSRTPRWVRGLKLCLSLSVCIRSYVAPHDGCVD